MSVYRFMDANRAEFTVSDMARVCEVARSGYYRWCSQSQQRSEADKRTKALMKKLRVLHTECHGRYGARRLHQMMLLMGEKISLRAVRRLMREADIRCVTRRAKRKTTWRDPHAGKAQDLVGRDFTADAPNRLWVADSTYIHTRQGFLYLAVVLDVWSRRIVGYCTSARHSASLMVIALNEALWQRNPKPDILVHHSDQGSQYTSVEFRERCEQAGILRSMGRVGNCYDNAMAESFFSTLELELLDLQTFETRQQAKAAIVQFIDGFYNTTRLHLALDYRSPIAFENEFKHLFTQTG